jgi:hypothetical protein
VPVQALPEAREVDFHLLFRSLGGEEALSRCVNSVR